MIELSPERIAASAGAEIIARGERGSPARAVIDSREVRAGAEADAGPGDLFVGIRGEKADGGSFAAQALESGAWGALVTPAWAAELAAAAQGDAWIMSAEDPLTGLQTLARAWRRELGCPVVGITGSTGKTSVKDICRAILPGRVHASPENFNTEIGLPLTILAAPSGTGILVLEMAMRGMGQIAELAEIAQPDIAAITNVGPVHLELLGTVDAIAEAKAEILQGLGGSGKAVLPAGAEALEPHLPADLAVLTFGPGGDVHVLSSNLVGSGIEARIGTPGAETDFRFPFAEQHNLANALCAVAIGAALELDPAEMATRTSRIEFSRLRGEQVALPGRILVLNDCYNANPISMRAAVENLATTNARRAEGRAVAVLGGMHELGPEGPAFHAEIGALARELGIGPLIGVGELARDYSPDRWAADADQAVDLVAENLQAGDVALIKGSRSIGLERLTDGLRRRLGGADA